MGVTTFAARAAARSDLALREAATLLRRARSAPSSCAVAGVDENLEGRHALLIT
jgi:hypothetical protein